LPFSKVARCAGACAHDSRTSGPRESSEEDTAVRRFHERLIEFRGLVAIAGGPWHRPGRGWRPSLRAPFTFSIHLVPLIPPVGIGFGYEPGSQQ
jgi:hypothetical protein